MGRTRAGLIAAAVVSAVLVTVGSAAYACSVRRPPNIADLEPGVPVPDRNPDIAVVGVYEYEYIARSPQLLISGPRSVSIVTRYWGEPPAHIGLDISGDGAGRWSTTSCGDTTNPVGTIAYWYSDEKSVDRPDWGRSWLTLEGTESGIDTAQEAMLEDHFGPPVVLGTTSSDRAGAVFILWKWHLLAIVLAAGVWAVIRIRRRHTVAD